MLPGTDWQEIVPASEAAELERLAEQLRDLQRRRARGRPALRALHAKGQVGAEAELEVLPDLPAHVRVGPFADLKTYRAFVRFSNGAGVRRADTEPDVRGIAVKVLGVPGRKLIPGLEQATTQDFLAILSPATPFRDAQEFVALVLAADNQALLLPRLVWRFGPLRALHVLSQVLTGLSRPVRSLAANHYFSALPIRFGPYAVHYAFAPHLAAADAPPPGEDPDYLAHELAQRLADGPVVYDFRVQFFVDEARTPIEDASREWREIDSPFTTLARLTLPRQDLSSPRARRAAELVERLSFDPWHAVEELRPLGNMMRARNAAYRLSTQERGAAPEPDGSERFD